MAVATTHEKMLIRGPVEFIHILELSLHTRSNEHGYMTVQGYLNSESAQSNSLRDLEGNDFSLFTLQKEDAGKLHPAFFGTADLFKVNRTGEVFFAKTHVVGATAQLDVELKSRSFQDVTMTYRQVVETVLHDTPNASADFADIADQSIQKPLIQYEETDWAFIKRLASMLRTQLIPDCTTPYPRFSFGYVSQTIGELASDEYAVIQDPRFYALGSTESGLYKPDFLCYVVPSLQYHRLGSQVTFNGQSLVVCEQDGILRDGELLYTYKIGRPNWFSQREIKNEKLIGLCLPGTVLETDREVARLKLDIDEGRKPGSYPFSWMPESGNIMYCMPKLGTRASLYLPSHNTGDAVVITSPRTNGDTCGEMSDPQNRCFTTEHGKKMGLFPKTMFFSGGAPTETLQIRLDDLNYMLAESTRAIQIVAKLQINVEAPRVTLSTLQELQTIRSPIQAQARVSLIVAKGTGGGNPPTGGGDTVLTMQYQFDALGEQGILCGTEFHDYPPFDDEPASFNLSGWLINIAIGAAVAAVFVAAAILTAGTSVILTGALVGAAVGAGVATTAIAVSDYQSGNVRSVGDAAFGIAGGALVGALVGATIASIPSIPTGLHAVESAIADFASKSITLIPPSVVLSGGEAALSGGLYISGQAIINAGGIATGIAVGELLWTSLMAMSKSGAGGQAPKPTSANQLDKQIQKGQAPRGVKRADKPDPQLAEPHVHFDDGTSITQSGKIHDAHKGTPNLTKQILDWLHRNGWCLDIK